jgi:hypothetical protein
VGLLERVCSILSVRYGLILEVQIVHEVDEVTPFRSTLLQHIFQHFQRHMMHLIMQKSSLVSGDSDCLKAWEMSSIPRTDLQNARSHGKTCRSQAKWIGFKW